MLTGTAMRTAIVALSSVPKMNAAAPKNLSGGAQREDVKKSGPMRSRAAHERLVIVMAMRLSTTSTSAAAARATHEKMRSGPASSRSQAGLDGGHRRDTSCPER